MNDSLRHEDDQDTARVRAYESDKERINERKRGTETQADVIHRLLEDAPAADTDADTVATEVASRIDYAAIGREAAEHTVEELQERGV